MAFDLLQQLAGLAAGFFKNSPCQPLLLLQQGQQQLFALQLLLALLLRQRLSCHHGAPGLFGELLCGGLHHGLKRQQAIWDHRMGPAPFR